MSLPFGQSGQDNQDRQDKLEVWKKDCPFGNVILGDRTDFEIEACIESFRRALPSFRSTLRVRLRSPTSLDHWEWDDRI